MVRKIMLTGVLALLMAVILACGGAAEPTEAPEPTAAPTATTAPAAPTATTAPAAPYGKRPRKPPRRKPTEAAMPSGDDDLKAVAARLAGGPGAIYVGDLNQLVGPVPANPSRTTSATTTAFPTRASKITCTSSTPTTTGRWLKGPT